MTPGNELGSLGETAHVSHAKALDPSGGIAVLVRA